MLQFLTDPPRTMSAGNQHLLRITLDGAVVVAGDGWCGQLGHEESITSQYREWTPHVLDLPSKAREVVAGFGYSVVLLENGDVYFCGNLGWEHSTVYSPLLLPLRGIVRVIPTRTSFVCITDTGEAFQYGKDGVFQKLPATELVVGVNSNLKLYYLGEPRRWNYGTEEATQIRSSAIWVYDQEFGFESWIQDVVMGPGYSIVLLADGTVWGFGSGDWGCLGRGDEDYNPTPDREFIQIPTDEYIFEISTGGSSTYLQGQSGKVYVTGKYHAGNQQMGRDNVFVTAPVEFVYRT
jgi:alpha-tubulin suppressor-like RCC1 family protein